ncbi:hypothetical protein ACFOPN_16570 [Xanthomonas hyacinthi]|uniref:hypothetical protein n=1 Tax=Xanthomonas hyacinthi TaxID=56455 RepID=UPI0036203052
MPIFILPNMMSPRLFGNDRATTTRPDVLPAAPRGSATIATAPAAAMTRRGAASPLLEGYRQAGTSPLIGATTAEFGTQVRACEASMNTYRAFRGGVLTLQEDARPGLALTQHLFSAANSARSRAGLNWDVNPGYL